MHITPERIGSPPVQTTDYILGMPQLCPSGLSESWLWKELGHRHWELIARAIGRAAEGFGMPGAPPVYAAFRRIALHGGDLGSVRENDAVEVRSTLAHLSETRADSRHSVDHRGRIIAEVEMSSVFVRRQTEGVNRSIVRVRIERAQRIPLSSGDAAAPARTAERRPAREPHQDGHEIGTVPVDLCPHLDFNGAGLLYFSSFVAAVDRAEWRLTRQGGTAPTTLERSALFHANVEVGDDLVVQIRALQERDPRHHRALIFASSDARLLAEITTRRGPPCS